MRRVSLVVVAVGLALGLNFCMARSFGLMPVRDCPEQTLSPADVEALYLKGVAATDEDMMGEHRLISSIEDGLPMLKTAALHGHLPAIDRMGSHFIQTGVISMVSLDGLAAPDAAAEGMMWHILEVHLKGEIPHREEEREPGRASELRAVLRLRLLLSLVLVVVEGIGRPRAEDRHHLDR